MLKISTKHSGNREKNMIISLLKVGQKAPQSIHRRPVKIILNDE